MLLPAIALSLLILLASGTAMALALRPGDGELADLEGPEQERAHLGLLTLALAWGLGMVPTAAFLLFTATGWPVAWPTLYGCAGLNLLAAAVIWRWRRGAANAALLPAGLLATLGRHRGPLLATLAIGLFYLLRYDQSGYTLMESCIHELGFVAVGALKLDVSPMVSSAQDARLAVPAVMSGFLAVFQGLGLPALFGFCGLMLALGGYLMGLARGDQGSGWIGMVLLALNPYVLRIPLVDENLVTLAFCAALVPWLTLRNAPWLQLGLLAGLVMGMRHILVLAMPAMWLACWLDGRNWRRLLTFTAATALATVPWHLHHQLALGSVLRFESFSQMPPAPHDFGFAEVMWNGLLNWPFHSQIVRTPHNPYPTFLMWPLYLFDHFGAALAALGAVGWLRGWLREPGRAAVWTLWFALAMAALLVQENWDYPNKMNVVLILFWAPLVWCIDGLRAMRSAVEQRSWWGPAAAVLVAGGVVVLGHQVRHWQVPADARYAGVEARRYGSPGPMDDAGERWDFLEEAALVERARAEVSDVGVLPDYGRATGAGAALTWSRVQGLWRQLSAPGAPQKTTPWGWTRHNIPAHGPAVTVRLDLSAPPWQPGEWLRLDEGPVDLDLTAGAGVQIVGPLSVPWSERPLTLLSTPAGAPVSGVLAVFGDHSFMTSRKPLSVRRANRYRDVREEFQWLMLGDGLDDAEAPMWQGREGHRLGRPWLRLRVPAGGFNAIWVVSILGARHLAWTATVGQRSVELSAGRSVVRN